jgi:hypothetical protein
MLQQVIGSIQLDLLRDLGGLSSGLQRDALVGLQNIGNGQRRGRYDAHGTRFGRKCLKIGNLIA